MHRAHRGPGGNGQRDDIGQVVFPLRIVVGEPAQPFFEIAGRCAHHAGIDFTDFFFCCTGVFFLDDARDRVVRITHDAPVAGGVFKDRSQERQSGGLRYQLRQSFISRKRNITVEDERCAAGQQVRCSLLNRMTCPELWLLQDELDCGISESGWYGVAAMTVNDDDPVRAQGPGTIQHVREHWLAGESVQNLRQTRHHACALAGGENHDVQGSVFHNGWHLGARPIIAQGPKMTIAQLVQNRTLFDKQGLDVV